jgi:hypothetical protein
LERRFCFFTVYKVHKKHHILKPSIVTPFVWFSKNSENRTLWKPESSENRTILKVPYFLLICSLKKILWIIPKTGRFSMVSNAKHAQKILWKPDSNFKCQLSVYFNLD